MLKLHPSKFDPVWKALYRGKSARQLSPVKEGKRRDQEEQSLRAASSLLKEEHKSREEVSVWCTQQGIFAKVSAGKNSTIHKEVIMEVANKSDNRFEGMRFGLEDEKTKIQGLRVLGSMSTWGVAQPQVIEAVRKRKMKTS